MNMNSDKIQNLLKLDDNEKFEMEMDLIHFSIIKHIIHHMDEKKRKELAEEIGVSNSFISQLFSGDKKINIKLMAKFQRALDFKFVIESAPNRAPQKDDIRPIYDYTLETKLSSGTKPNFSILNVQQC